LHKTEQEYVSLICQSISMNEFLAQKKKINIVKDFNIKEQLIRIDKGKIEQVMNNLLGNAIKYSNSDTVITVKVFSENSFLVTQVIDQGQGIPKEELGGIFKYFQKTSVLPTSNEKSHGLGLAIAKNIVEGHLGEVSVQSEPGKGSTFQFTLPL